MTIPSTHESKETITFLSRVNSNEQLVRMGYARIRYVKSMASDSPHLTCLLGLQPVPLSHHLIGQF